MRSQLAHVSAAMDALEARLGHLETGLDSMAERVAQLALLNLPKDVPAVSADLPLLATGA